MSDMNYIDLFSGIGGFALGARWAGMKFKHHFNSDIDEYANKVYAKHFPESIQLGDITKIDTSELKKLPGEFIISGGFPCQDISIAGKGAGIHGERSGLWFEYWRLIRDIRPRFAIMENVGMLVRRGLREVLGSLVEIGYNAEWQDIRASDIGAPHRRERIWIIAYPDTTGYRWNRERKVSEIKERLQQKSRNTRKLESGFKRLCEDVADTNKTGLQAERAKQQTARTFGNDTQVSNSTIKGLERQKSERWNGWESGLSSKCSQWSTEPDVGRVANGIPARVDRLKCLGNSIVPQIAEILFTRIKYILESEHRTCEHNDKVSNFT